MQIIGDRTKCVGSGLCEFNMPDVFTQDEAEGLVVVLSMDGGGHDRGEVDDVAYGCPSQAIQVSA